MMIILDKPYISSFMEDTMVNLQIPVLDNEALKEFELSGEINILAEMDFIKKIKNNENTLIYSNSENSINWIVNNLGFTDLPKKINLFKDKYLFRELIKDIYPNFFYMQIDFNELEKLNTEHLKYPFIIKPSVGFFSMGVHKVNNHQEWNEVIQKIKKEFTTNKNLYPKEVIDANKFIIEENIEGDEFAIDAYFDSLGNPVVLNMFKHVFSNDDDVSDRVYISSKEIIEENLEAFTHLLSKIGKLGELKNFPVHLEVRKQNNNVVPIELNPMRFAGWCTTDIAYYSYGINVYDYYFNQKKPNWQEILKGKDHKIYSIVVGDIPKDIDVNTIKHIDYDKFLNDFSKPLNIRKIDYNIYPVFAFLFTETDKKNYNELERILASDLKEYIVLND